MADLNLTNTEYGGIATWFLLAYTISQSLSGKLYDRIGIKKGFSVSIIVWSVAAMMHAFATGLRSLSIFRFILGLGEAGNWPGAAKTVAEWFPARQRALGMAIFNSGAAIGSIVAPPIIVGLTAYFGHWYETFIFTGLFGFIWLIFWWLIYDTPENHKWLTKREYDLIQENEEVTDIPASEQRPLGWFELLTYRQTWAIVLARFLVDPIWWLYITWLPLFLYKVHGFNLKDIGLFAWVPFVAADAGSLFGGWLSGFLIGRGWTVNNARKIVIGFAACLMPAGILAAYTPTALVDLARSLMPSGLLASYTPESMLALALIGVVLFGFQVWINNVQTLPADLFPKSAVGSVAGLGGTGAGIGSMIFVFTTGWVVDNFSYTPILVAAGVLAPIGTALLFILMGRIHKVGLDKNA
jgi:ACS family hexuronate transporter-like MFS transporter